MPWETWVTVLACGVALLALAAALLAVRALVRLRREVSGLQASVEAGPATATPATATPATATPATDLVHVPTPLPTVDGSADGRPRQVLPHERAVVTQEGTVIVLPSEEQVVAATMGRPLVRGAVLSHGLLYALRPESRDRIRGIVRREFRRRRKVRRRAARAASRTAPVSHDPTSWVGGSPTTEQEGTR